MRHGQGSTRGRLGASVVALIVAGASFVTVPPAHAVVTTLTFLRPVQTFDATGGYSYIPFVFTSGNLAQPAIRVRMFNSNNTLIGTTDGVVLAFTAGAGHGFVGIGSPSNPLLPSRIEGFADGAPANGIQDVTEAMGFVLLSAPSGDPIPAVTAVQFITPVSAGTPGSPHNFTFVATTADGGPHTGYVTWGVVDGAVPTLTFTGTNNVATASGVGTITVAAGTLPRHVYAYADSTSHGAGGRDPGELVGIATLVPMAQPTTGAYPSDDCTTGTNVFTGWTGNAHTSLRMTSSPTTICVAVEAANRHVGGKLSLAFGSPPVPSIDNNAAACADATHAGEHVPIRDLSVLGMPFTIDAKRRPATGEAWVCVRAESTARRFVIRTGVDGIPSWSPDPDTPRTPAYPVQALPAGKASSICQQSAGEAGRLLNATVGSTQASAYVWQEAVGRTHACVRVGATGGRLTVAANGGTTVATTDNSPDLSVCPQQVYADGGPPPSHLYISTSTSPAWACLKAGTTVLRVQVDSTGGQGVVTFTPDA